MIPQIIYDWERGKYKWKERQVQYFFIHPFLSLHIKSMKVAIPNWWALWDWGVKGFFRRKRKKERI